MPQNPSTLPREFWDLKVSRDNLLNELDFLHGLLDIMYSKATKGLATYYCVVAFLSVTTLMFSRTRLTYITRAVVMGTTTSVQNTIGKIFWGVSTTALCAAASFTSLMTRRVVCMRRCKSIIFGLYRAVQDETLTETHKNNLEGTAFQELWWSSYLLTRKPASDDE